MAGADRASAHHGEHVDSHEAGDVVDPSRRGVLVSADDEGRAEDSYRNGPAVPVQQSLAQGLGEAILVGETAIPSEKSGETQWRS
jgi:hypothetical protein